jgi:hypothetical protein
MMTLAISFFIFFSTQVQMDLEGQQKKIFEIKIVLEIQAMWSPDLSPCPIPEFIEKH